VSDARPNLILGLVQRLEWEQLRPFVESLRRTSFDGELRLFVAEVSPATVRELERHGVEVVPFRRVHLDVALPGLRHTVQPYMASLRALHPLYARATATLSLGARDGLRRRASIAAWISLVHVARFLRFYTFLVEQGPRYANVLLTDTRDVFFQRDPFDFAIGNEVHCFLEDEAYTLGTCEFNSRWLLDTYGSSVAAELWNRRISCVGVTIGSYDAVLEYLRLLARELVRVRHQTSGADTAAHNYLLHNGLIPNVRVVENGAGAVLTMAKMRDVTVEQLVDPHGEPYNVLHQYDRHSRIAAHLLAELDRGTQATAGRGDTVERYTRDVPRPIA
jgi:hypothetical protein